MAREPMTPPFNRLILDLRADALSIELVQHLQADDWNFNIAFLVSDFSMRRSLSRLNPTERWCGAKGFPNSPLVASILRLMSSVFDQRG